MAQKPRIGRAKIRHHTSAVSLPRPDVQQGSSADAEITEEPVSFSMAARDE